MILIPQVSMWLHLMFCFSYFKLTLRVGRERGRFLEVIFEVRLGHVLNFPLFIAWMKVDFVGQPESV